MKSGFKDPIAVRNQEPKDKPVDGKKSPWDFRAPNYDQRSSCFVSAGTHYGVGFNQPVGSSRPAKYEGVPMGVKAGMEVDEKS